jgi:cell division protein FtsL
MIIAMTKQQSKEVLPVGRGMRLPVGNALWLMNIFLLLLVVASALGVIYSSYMSRQLFSELQQGKRQAMSLEENWGRLLLEQSTWASHSRVEQLAKTKLKMKVPDPALIVVVAP